MFAQHGLLFRLDVHEILEVCGRDIKANSAFVLEASFVDDAAHPILGPATTILEQIKLVILILDSVFTRYGLKLKFKAGKTEVLIVFAGGGPQNLRKQVLVDMEGKMPFQNVQGENKTLLVTDVYKNLGSKVVISQSLNPECQQRLGGRNGEGRLGHPHKKSNNPNTKGWGTRQPHNNL